MTVIDLFPIRCMVEERSEPLSKDELKYLSEIEMHHNGSFLLSNDDHILEHKRFSSIKKFIEKSLNKYMDEVLHSPYKLRITTSWLNIEQNGMSHPRHNHQNSFLSGVFYFTDIGKSPLHVYNPHPKLWDYDPQTYNVVNSYEWSLPLVKNSCVIFPSTLEHAVQVHNDPETDRFSLAFNSFFDSDIGSEKSRTTLTFS
tara:strand:- start:15 stop:611 length:597 start_codon:yes stop_codon:yes gene_type:complete